MRVKIYQINSNRDKAHFRFSNLAETTKLMQGNGVDSSLYDEVFNAELGNGDLEEIYTKFNIERHYFMLPNEIFSLGLKPRDFAVLTCLIRHKDNENAAALLRQESLQSRLRPRRRE